MNCPSLPPQPRLPIIFLSASSCRFHSPLLKCPESFLTRHRFTFAGSLTGDRCVRLKLNAALCAKLDSCKRLFCNGLRLWVEIARASDYTRSMYSQLKESP